MTEIAVAAPPPPSLTLLPQGRRLGAWQAAGWLLAIFAVSQAVGLVVTGLWWAAGNLENTGLFENGPLLLIATSAAFPFQLLTAWLAARRYAPSAVATLGLDVKPGWRVCAGFAVLLMVFVGGSDLVSYLTGRPLVSSFQTEVYRTANDAGYVVLVWLTFVAFAPVIEEIMFRGIAFTGFVPAWGKTATVIVVTAAWSALHIQYDAVGIAQVFAAGILLSLARLASGSIWLPIALHAALNAWGTVETALLR